MTVKQAIEAIDGVNYVTIFTPGRWRIVLSHGAPFDIVDEIRDTVPATWELEEWGATQEHLPAIEVSTNHE